MLLLYYGTGSRSLELVAQSMSEDEQHELFINVSSALKSRGHKRALELFEIIPFSVKIRRTLFSYTVLAISFSPPLTQRLTGEKREGERWDALQI